LSFFTGFLISDGYSAYQQLLPQLAGVQQCCQHVIRRCRAVAKLGPGSLQSWAADVIEVLREARQAVDDALARGDPALDGQLLAKLRERYDQAVAFGITHNRHRDWHQGNHPGYALGCWLRDYKEQVWLFTTQFAADWTKQLLRAGRQGGQAPPGRLRVLAHPPDTRPLVPHPQLPRLGGKPRHDRPRRYYPSPCRRPLATSASPLSRDPDVGGEQNPLPLT
jgi:Transposase IS66 family